ncbi:DUF6792 domain-containing protein [Geobacillus sp. PA-3]|uniref:DUF6792 domain-containing protein n=1 Tax=Geobacillus sp. PA-3 TaxID=1699078 RepID=UPI0035115A36
MKVYRSDDFKKGKDFGFDGTIIHFYDEKQGINQKYTITRGSEMPEHDTWKSLDRGQQSDDRELLEFGAKAI